MPLVQSIPDGVGALPYIDPLAEEEKELVNQLILEEARTFRSDAQHLASLPHVDLFLKDSPILQSEFARIRDGQPMGSLDMSRYQLEAPQQSKRNDVAAWKAATATAQAQLEHQYLRIINLELLNRFGVSSFRVHCEDLRRMLAGIQAQLKQCKMDIENINKERNMEQILVGQKLHNLEVQWQDLIQKNLEIETACHLLERRVDTQASS
eukprot:tig00000217_g19155.t1